MSLIFVQTDAGATQTGTPGVGCSGRSLTANLVNGSAGDNACQVDGVAGSGSASASAQASDTNIIYASWAGAVDAGVSWSSGTWTVRWNVTTSNMNFTTTEVFICRMNSSGVSQQTIGSSTGLGISHATTGVKSATISGAAATPSPGDFILVLLVGTNAAMSVQNPGVINGQNIDSPFTPATGSVGASTGTAAGSGVGRSTKAGQGASAGVTTVTTAAGAALKTAVGTAKGKAFGLLKLDPASAGAAIQVAADMVSLTTNAATASTVKTDEPFPESGEGYFEFELTAFAGTPAFGLGSASLSSSAANLDIEQVVLVSGDVGARYGFGVISSGPGNYSYRVFRNGSIINNSSTASPPYPALRSNASGVEARFYFKSSEWTQTSTGFNQVAIPGDVGATGSVAKDGVAAAAGTNTTQATGVGAALAVGSSNGVTTSTSGIGKAVTNAQAQAAGLTAGSVVGTGLVPTVGSAAGVTTAANMQSGSAIGSMSSVGVSTVQATGRAATNAQASAAGVAADAVVGKSLFNAKTTSVNNANLNGVGRSTTNAVANAAGTTPTALAPGQNVGQGQASAAGATGGVVVGVALLEAIGEAVGLGIAQGSGVALGFFSSEAIDIDAVSEALAVGASVGNMSGFSESLSQCTAIARQRGWARSQHGNPGWNKQESV